MLVPKNNESAIVVPDYVKYLPEGMQKQQSKEFRDVLAQIFYDIPSEKQLEVIAPYVSKITNKEYTEVLSQSGEADYDYTIEAKISADTTITISRCHLTDPDTDLVYVGKHITINSYGETYHIPLDSQNNIDDVFYLALVLDQHNSHLNTLTPKQARAQAGYTVDMKQKVTKALSIMEYGQKLDLSRDLRTYLIFVLTGEEKQKAFALATALTKLDVIPKLPAEKYTKDPDKFMKKLPELASDHTDKKAKEKQEKDFAGMDTGY